MRREDDCVEGDGNRRAMEEWEGMKGQITGKGIIGQRREGECYCTSISHKGRTK